MPARRSGKGSIKPAADERERPDEDRMPRFVDRPLYRMPEEREFLAAAIIGEVSPGVRCVPNLAEDELPALVGFDQLRSAERQAHAGGNDPRLLSQFPQRRRCGGFPVFDRALDSCFPARGWRNANTSTPSARRRRTTGQTLECLLKVSPASPDCAERSGLRPACRTLAGAVASVVEAWPPTSALSGGARKSGATGPRGNTY